VPRWRRQFAGFLALCTALLVAGCDRQKGPEPQPKEISSPTKADGGAAAAQRYRIDLSAAGTPLPSVQLTGPDGQPRNLNTLKGKPVLLNLWATWCAPCVEELPTINTLAARAGTAAHVVTLSQDIGGDATVPNAFLTERGWTHVESWHDPDNELGIAVGGALPTTIIYNSDGLEVGRVIGPLDWTGPQAIDLLNKSGFALQP
jgi:thiol-disulfide isomerase/thioredoxin